MNIKDIYIEIIKNSIYDEKFGGNQQVIDDKVHGVCIDFSRNLIKRLRDNKVKCGLISTVNDEGFLHAAVIYVNPETGVTVIADPVTDVKNIGKLTLEEIISQKNYCIDIRKYYEMNGPITDYDDTEYEETQAPANPRILRKNMNNYYEIISNPYVVSLEKKSEAIQAIKDIRDVEKVADTSSLLACQLLYEKGINTFCSNFESENGYCDISIDYNSLSEENKNILFELIKEKSENYKIYDKRKIFGYPTMYVEGTKVDDVFPMVVCIGFIKNNNTQQYINLDMAELISKFKKQRYLQGIYTREEVLLNKHNYMKLSLIQLNLENCNSSKENSNEEIAINEGLMYSPKFNVFYENDICLSRYIESIYRKENDWRTNEEIAIENNLPFKDGLFIDVPVLSSNLRTKR